MYDNHNTIWINTQILYANNTLGDIDTINYDSDNFGRSVCITSNSQYIIVGAVGVDNHAGSAYIFELNNNTNRYYQIKQLIANDRESSDFFGISVSMSVNYNYSIAVVGAYHKEDLKGASYIFIKNDTCINWCQVQKLISSDYGNDTMQLFGTSVSIFKNYMAIGAPGTSGYSGASYIYEFDSIGQKWILKDYIIYLNCKKDDSCLFGNSVKIYDDILIVGSYYDTVYNITDAGSVYIYSIHSVKPLKQNITTTMLTTISTVNELSTTDASNMSTLTVDIINVSSMLYV